MSIVARARRQCSAGHGEAPPNDDLPVHLGPSLTRPSLARQPATRVGGRGGGKVALDWGVAVESEHCVIRQRPETQRAHTIQSQINRLSVCPSWGRASHADTKFFCIEFARWAGDVALTRQAPHDRIASRDHGCVVQLIQFGSFALAGVAGVDEIMHRRASGAIKPVLYRDDRHRRRRWRIGLAAAQRSGKECG